MSIPHFFIDNNTVGSLAGTVPGAALELPVTERLARHLHTLRLRAGEHIVLSDGRGHGWELELAAAVEKRKALLHLILVCEHDSCHCAHLTLVQGLAVSERMDLLVRQATELGIARIIPLESERSTVRLDAAGRQAKLARWQRIAEEAAGQSGQLWLPQIEPPCRLGQALSLLDGYERLLFFWEEAGRSAPSVAQFFSATAGTAGCGGGSAGDDAGSGSDTGCASAGVGSSEGSGGGIAGDDGLPRTAVIIGPEGGFSADEAKAVQAAGAATLTLGSTILRTETAAVVATALVLEQLRLMANDRPDAALVAAVVHESQHRHLP